MNISSLLCADDGPQQPRHHQPTPSPPLTLQYSPPRRPSPPAVEPVILAPHLRGTHSQKQRVTSQECTSPPPGISSRARSQDCLPSSHLLPGKRSYSPDPVSLSSRTIYCDMDDNAVDGSRSLPSYAFGQPQPQRHMNMEASPLASAQRSSYRPGSEMSHHSRPSSSQSHSRSPVQQLSHYPSALPASLSRITYSPTFPPVDRPSPPSRRSSGSPLASFRPSSRPQISGQRTASSSHSRSPIQRSPPERSNSNPNSNPNPPLYTQFRSSASVSPAITKQQSPYMGLEALVHAASQEHRRLSGTRTDAEDAPEDRQQSRSPVIDRGHHFTEERRMGYAQVGGYEAVEPRPIKKQRLSDPVLAERDFTPQMQSLPLRLSGPGIPAYPVDGRVALGVDGFESAQKDRVESRKLSSESSKSNKSRSRPADTRSADISMEEPTPPLPTPMDTGSGRSHKEALASTLAKGLIAKKEQDAHEWLLEHYAGSTPSPTVTAPMPSMQGRGGHVPSGSGSRTSSDRARSRAPEIANDIERELEDLVGPSKHKLDTDPDLALELVEKSLDIDEPSMSDRVSMEVDDELLSLVNDPAPPRQYGHMPLALRISKPLTPTVITVPANSPYSPAINTPFHPTPTPTSECGSMPPPPSTAAANKSGKKAESTTAKPKKAATQKSAPKPRQPAKLRTKAAPKPKAAGALPAPPAISSAIKLSKNSATPASAIKKTSAAAAAASASRSRSASVIPDEPEKEAEADEEEEEEEKEDHKLYCVCKTKYDEDRVMIACDRCDEWYHTQCVNMPDLEVDLVDQFYCPPCIQCNVDLDLQTTYKKRCFRGLNHPTPSSPQACHRASRGDFSKYCSDECGVEFMKSKIDVWAKKGGNREKLWETVRHAERREGVVVCVNAPKDESQVNGTIKPLVPPTKLRNQRDIDKLNNKLNQVSIAREKLKKEMDVIIWRMRVVDLANERSEKMDECAWDQRLCFGDEEYTEFGAEVLATYEEISRTKVEVNGDDAMQVDGTPADQWWCRGKRKCERHAGWQKLRAAEVSFEKEMKEAGIQKLTTRERELRKRLEDLLDPHARNPLSSVTRLHDSKLSVNGHTKTQSNGDVGKKGKKKRVY